MKKVSYRTEDGALEFVFSPADCTIPIYYAVKMKSRGEGEGKGPRRIHSPLLKRRMTWFDAQRDLDNYAKLQGWKPAYVD